MAAHMNEFADLMCADEDSWDEEVICRLQAYIRAFLIRKKFQNVRKVYEEIAGELDGDICSSIASKRNPSIIHWKTSLPCRPCILPKPHKSRKAQTHPTPDPDSIRDANQETDLRSGGSVSQAEVKDQGTIGGSELKDDNKSIMVGCDDEQGVNGGISRSNEVVNHPTQTRHLMLSANHYRKSCSEEDGDGSPRQNEDAAHQDQNVTPSEEGIAGPQESSKQSNCVSESGNRHSTRDSPVSSEEYTPDFESYASTTTSQDADLSSGNDNSLEFSVVTPFLEQTAVKYNKVLDGMENREVSSEETGHKETGSKSPDGSAAIENNALNPSSESGKATRTDKLALSNQQYHHKTPTCTSDCDDEAATSSRDETRTLSSSGDDGVKLSLQDEAGKSTGDIETEKRASGLDLKVMQPQSLCLSTDNARTKLHGDSKTDFPDAGDGRTVTNKEIDRETGASDGNSETETVPSPSYRSHITENQRDKRVLEIDHASGDEKGEDGGWRPSLRESGEAGRSIPVTSEMRRSEQDSSVAADMTSIWSNENSLTELQVADYPSDLRDLQQMRSSVALELLWIQQAIGSRKNYLRLKTNIQPERQSPQL